MLKKSTKEKFSRYYRDGSDGNNYDLILFIKRNWKKYQIWSNNKAKEEAKSA